MLFEEKKNDHSIIGRVSSGLDNASIHLDITGNYFSTSAPVKRHQNEPDEIECNIDEDFDNEHYSGKNINNSFINKLKDFSTFNPSGNKGKEKIIPGMLNMSAIIVVPQSLSRAGGAAHNRFSNLD